MSERPAPRRPGAAQGPPPDRGVRSIPAPPTRWSARHACHQAARGAFLAALAGAALPPVPSPAAATNSLATWATARLAADPNDAAALDSLQHVLGRGNAPAADDTEIRAILHDHPRATQVDVAPPGEPGTSLVVRGTVRDVRGHPIAGALLHVFQADATGRYTAARAMDEPQARLMAWLHTDPGGQYELHTIRPGGYAKPVQVDGRERLIPAHIHFEISATGHPERRFQLVFDDDPRLDAYWRGWAATGRHPIAAVTRAANGAVTSVCDIALDAN